MPRLNCVKTTKTNVAGKLGGLNNQVTEPGEKPSCRLLQLQTIKAIVDSCSFKSPKSAEPRRVKVLDLYCLTRFESEGSSKEIIY